MVARGADDVDRTSEEDAIFDATGVETLFAGMRGETGAGAGADASKEAALFAGGGAARAPRGGAFKTRRG